jgi:DNA polymerase-3 subunit epsilon
MLTRLDVADRLVRAVEERGALSTSEAARTLLALPGHPSALARALLADAVGRDARVTLVGDEVRLSPAPLASVPLDRASFAVVDLETTGFVAGQARICEVGAVLVERGEIVRELEVTVGPDESPAPALRRLAAFARRGVLAGHNVRFDVSFIDHELALRDGRRLAAPVVDTMVLARRLLRGRIESASLAALAVFFGTAAEPCHRALPDARATAEILLRLVALARERGAASIADLCALARPRRSPADHLA